MIAFSDPERSALQELEQHRIEQAWRRGAIGDSTYLRSLVFAGETPADAASRLRMLKADLLATNAEAKRLDASYAWLNNR